MCFTQAFAPLILLPENEESDRGLLVRLGDFYLSNEFVEEEIGSAPVLRQSYDVMNMSLTNVGIERLVTLTSSCSLTSPFSLTSPVSLSSPVVVYKPFFNVSICFDYSYGPDIIAIL